MTYKRTKRRGKRTKKRDKMIYKRTKRRGKRTKKKQCGGVRFSDIITGENKNKFIGREVEIKRIRSIIPPEYETDQTGHYMIDNLVNKPGYIQDELVHVRGELPGTLLVVYYPHIEPNGGNVELHIPGDIRHLSQNLLDQQDDLTYIVNLRRPRGPDLFNRAELLSTAGENKRMNALNPTRKPFSHGYTPPGSLKESIQDKLGYIPHHSRYLSRDILSSIDDILKEQVLNDRYLRRSRMYGSRMYGFD